VETRTRRLYATPSPLAEPAIGEQLAANVGARICELEDTHHGQTMTSGGIVSNLRSFMTRKGQMMGAVTLEDLPGAIEVICFPRIWQRIAPELSNDRVVLATGRIEGDDASPRMLADNIYTLSAATASNGSSADNNAATVAARAEDVDEAPMPPEDEPSTDFYIPEPIPEADESAPPSDAAEPEAAGVSDAAAIYEPDPVPEPQASEPAHATVNGSDSPGPADQSAEPTPSDAANETDDVAGAAGSGNDASAATNGSANGSRSAHEVDEPAPPPPAAPLPNRVVVTLRRSPDPSFDLDLLKRLNAAVTYNQGPTPLHLHVVKTDGSVSRLRWPKTVRPDESLLEELSAQFGKDSIAVA